MFGCWCEPLDALAAVLGEHDLHAALLERRGEREHVADVVVDHEHLAAVQGCVAGPQMAEQLPGLDRQRRFGPVQEQRRAVDQPLRRVGDRDHGRLRGRVQPRAVGLGQAGGDERDQRKLPQDLVRRGLADQRERG